MIRCFFATKILILTLCAVQTVSAESRTFECRHFQIWRHDSEDAHVSFSEYFNPKLWWNDGPPAEIYEGQRRLTQSPFALMQFQTDFSTWDGARVTAADHMSAAQDFLLNYDVENFGFELSEGILECLSPQEEPYWQQACNAHMESSAGDRGVFLLRFPSPELNEYQKDTKEAGVVYGLLDGPGIFYCRLFLIDG